MKNSKEYRMKNFRGARIIDTMEFLQTLTKRHQELLETYQQKASKGDESAQLLAEYQKGMVTMSMTIQSHLEHLFEYERDTKGA